MPIKEETPFSIQQIVQKVHSDTRNAGRKRAATAEEEELAKLKEHYAGKVVYVYDESHENRFAKGEFREFGSVAFSFEECLKNVKPHIIRYRGNDYWAEVEKALSKLGKVTPTQEKPIVFHVVVGPHHQTRWNAFWCLPGEKFYEHIVEHLKWHKDELERNSRSDGDNYDNL